MLKVWVSLNTELIFFVEKFVNLSGLNIYCGWFSWY